MKIPPKPNQQPSSSQQQYQSSPKIITFKSSFTKRHLSKQYLKLIRNYNIQNQSWQLGDRRFRDCNAKDIFSHSEHVNGKVLWADYNKNPSIIKEISSPFFNQLQMICLGDNNITSIEGLAYLKIPSIKWISLNDNLITNLKPFTKCYLPNLQYLSLKGNCIRQFDFFQKATFNKVTKLKLMQQQGVNLWQNLNVKWIVKTNLNYHTEVIFDNKLILTPEVYLIKMKIRRKNQRHPCMLAEKNSLTN